MNALNNLLDKARETRSLPSDNALAGALGVSRQRVSAWRHGTNYPDPVACARIAEVTGEPLSRVLGVVGEARAISADEKRVWRRLAQAAAVAAVAMMAGWMPLPVQASATQDSRTLTDAPSMHYAKLRRALARMLQRLLSRFIDDKNAPALLAAR